MNENYISKELVANGIVRKDKLENSKYYKEAYIESLRINKVDVKYK